MNILTWKVIKTIPTACPDYQPDKYTGEYPSTHCSVYHCETITENKTTEFETEEKAKEFARKAPNSCYDFKLNGESLEDKRPRAESGTITVSGDLTSGGGTTTINAGIVLSSLDRPITDKE